MTVQLELKKRVRILKKTLMDQLRDETDSHIPLGRRSSAVFN